MEKITIFWFRRDLRLEDNTGFNKALKGDFPVLPLFIFDPNILSELPEDDARVSFIYNTLKKIRARLTKENSSSLAIYLNEPLEVFKELDQKYDLQAV